MYVKVTDYKVLVLTVTKKEIPAAFQEAIATEKGEVRADDVSKQHFGYLAHFQTLASATKAYSSCEEFEAVVHDGEQAKRKEHDAYDIFTHQIAETGNTNTYSS